MKKLGIKDFNDLKTLIPNEKLFLISLVIFLVFNRNCTNFIYQSTTNLKKNFSKIAPNFNVFFGKFLSIKKLILKINTLYQI